MKGHRKTLAVALAITVLAATGTVTSALAFWGGSGAGTARVRLDDPRALVLGPGTPGAGLSPGGTADVTLLVTNPNPYPAHIAGIDLDSGSGNGGFDVDAGHSGCGTTSLGFTPQDVGWTVPPSVGATDGSLPISLAGALSMSTDADDGCQGATFSVHLAAGS